MNIFFYLTQQEHILSTKVVEASIKLNKAYYGWHALELKGTTIVRGYINKMNQPITGSYIFESSLSMPVFTMTEYQSGHYAIQISQFNPDVSDTLEYLFQNIGSNLIGIFPAIWTYPKYQNIPHTGCFSSCTGLENYNEIPDDWK